MSTFMTGGIVSGSNIFWWEHSYDSFAQTSAEVTIYKCDHLGNRTPAWSEYEPLTFYVYVLGKDPSTLDANEYYHYYSSHYTPVRAVAMTRGSTPGKYTANYAYLPANQYAAFAVGDGPEPGDW